MAKEELIYEINVVANESVKRLGEIVGSANDVKKAFTEANDIISRFQDGGNKGFAKMYKETAQLSKKTADLPTQLEKVQKAIDFIVQGMDKAARSGDSGFVKTLQNELDILRMVELKIQNMQAGIKKDNYTERLKAQQKEETQVNRLIDVYNRLQKRIENTVEVGKEMSRLAFKTNGDRSESVIASIEKIIGSRADGNAAWSRIGENGYNKGYDQYLNRVSQSAVAQAAKISDLTEQYNKLHAAMERRVTGGNAGNISKIAEEQGKLQKLSAELSTLTQGQFQPGKYETMSVQAIQNEASSYKQLHGAIESLNKIRAKETELILSKAPVVDSEIKKLEQQANTARNVANSYKHLLPNGKMLDLSTPFIGTENRDTAQARAEARIAELTTKHQDLIRTMRDAEAAGKSMGEALFNANQKAEASIVAELAAYKQSAEVVYNSFKQHKMVAEETARLKERVFYKNDFWGSDKNIDKNENRKELTNLKNWIETLNKEGKVTKELQDEYNKLAEARVKSITSGRVGSISNWETQTQRMIELSRKLGLSFNEISSVQNMSFAQGQKAANEYGVVVNAVNDLIKVQREEMRIMGSGSKVSADKVRELEERADANRKLIESNKHLIQSEIELSTPFQGKDMSTIIREAKATAVASWRSYSQQIGDTRKNIEQLYYLYQRNPEAKTIQGFQKQILALKQTSKEYETFQKTISKTGTVYDWFADRVLHHLTWLSSGLALGAIMAIPHETIQSIKDLEYGLAGVRQVMTSIEHGGPAAQQELESLVGIASRYGVEIKEVMEAAKSIGRMYGKGEEGMMNTNLVTEQAAKMAVADAFDVETAYRGLESALSQFNLQTENSAELMTNTNRIIDVWTRTSHSGAASAADIGHAIEAAGTAAAQAGMSFEYFNALVAAGVRATARSGSEIGQAIKSMMVSLQTAKSQKELAKWGITLTEVGDDGAKHMRNIEDVILDIAKLVNTTDKDTSKLLQTLSGGKYQYSKISAILRNYQEIYRVLGQINDAETVGFTDKQAQIQLDTYQRQLQQLKADLQGLFTDIGNAGLLDALKGAVKLIDNLVVGMRELKSVNGGLVSVAAGFTSVYVAMKGISKVVDFALLIKETYAMAAASQYAGKTQETAAIAVTRARAAQRLANQGVILSEENVARAAYAAAGATNADTLATEANIREHQKQAVALAGGTRKLKNWEAGLAAVGGPIGLLTIALMGLGAAYAYVADMAGEAAKKQREQAETSAKQISSETQRLQQMQENLKELESLVKQYNDAVKAEANFDGDPESKENERLIAQRKYLRQQLENLYGKWNVEDAMENGLIDLKTLKDDFFADFAPQVKKIQDANIEGYKKAVTLEETLTRNKEEQLKIQEKINTLMEKDNDDLLISGLTGGLSKEDTIKSLKDRLDNLQKEEIETNDQLRLLRLEGKTANDVINSIDPNATKKKLGGTIDEEPTEKDLKKQASELKKLENAAAKAWKERVKGFEQNISDRLADLDERVRKYGATSQTAAERQAILAEKQEGYRQLLAEAPKGITSGGDSKIGGFIVEAAKGYNGTPYLFGGVDKGGIDCSALVQNAYGKMEIELPRTADAQQAWFAERGAYTEGDSESVASNAKAGDVVLMDGSDPPYGHIGIATGKGTMWAADSGGVHETDISGRDVVGYGSLSAALGGGLDGSADEKLEDKIHQAMRTASKALETDTIDIMNNAIRIAKNKATERIASYGGNISEERKEAINLDALAEEITAMQTALGNLEEGTVKYTDTLANLDAKQVDYENRRRENDANLALKPYSTNVARVKRDTSDELAQYEAENYKDNGSYRYEKLQAETIKDNIRALQAKKTELAELIAKEEQRFYTELQGKQAEITRKQEEIDQKRQELSGMTEGSEEYNAQVASINQELLALDNLNIAYLELYNNSTPLLEKLKSEQSSVFTDMAGLIKKLYSVQDQYSENIKQSVASTLTDLIVKGNNFKESLQNLLQQIASMFIKSQLLKWFAQIGLTSIGGKASIGGGDYSSFFGSSASVLARGGSLKGYADGGKTGYISGAGTGRSDDILAYLADKDRFVYLSNGEYVLNAKATKQLGKQTLDKLNYGYADGGALDPVPYVPSISSDVQERTLSKPSGNAYTEQLLAEQNKKMDSQTALMRNMGEGSGDVVVLNTHASSDDVVRAIQENPRVIQNLLGRQKKMGFR